MARPDAKPVPLRQRLGLVDVRDTEGLLMHDIRPLGDGDHTSRLVRVAHLELEPPIHVLDRRV
jgi:hypothetical protein